MTRVEHSNDIKQQSIGRWVWFYYNQGFSIIPLKYKDKKPNIEKWQEFQEKRPTEQQIKEWLKNGLFKNIGVICGKVSNNLVVIDIDEAQLVLDLSLDIDKIIEKGSWVVKTGRGYHIYCRHNADPGEVTKYDQLKIERRGSGGYVVAPPSIHPTGRKYEFLNIKNISDLDPLKIIDVDPIWKDLFERTSKLKGIKIHSTEKPPEMENIEADCIKNVFKGGLTEGKRNDTAFALANYYKYVKTMNPTEIRSLVRDWNKRNKNPLPDRELSSIVTSALKSDKKIGCKRWTDLGFCPHEDKKHCLFIHPNTPNIPNQPNQPNTPNIKDQSHLIKHFLEKEKRPYQSIGRGLNNDVFYLGTYIDDDSETFRDAVVTSDRKIYIDLGKGKNQIKDIFNLNYRDHFFFDVLDSSWSNNSIKKWLFENYTISIKTLYKSIIEKNKEVIIYEDERNHIYTAIDLLRSYFFSLFDANSRTHHLADPGAGKTNQIMVYRALAFNPIASPDFSSATIYRIIESTGGTILIDDFDDLPDEEKQKIRRHIKVNYKPFKAMRADGGKNFRPQGYNAYSHLVFNNTDGLGHDEITKERVITLRLLKHRSAKDITVNYKNKKYDKLRDDLYICLLQYWKEIKDSYDTLKVEELTARELEIFKPHLAIAKVIGEDVYQQILSFALWYLEQESIKELSDDWEFLLYEYLWKNTYELDENDDKKTKDFSVKEIADSISKNQFIDFPREDLEKKKHQLECFIGGKLTNPIFKKKRPHNRVLFEIHKKGLKQILETKRWLGVLGVLGQLGRLVVKNQADVYEIGEEHKDLVSKIEKCMETKLFYDWSINEICETLGYSSLENRNLVDIVLRELSSNPNNPTSIKKSVDDEYYHLTNIKVEGAY
jgi:hypothetical protein